MDDRRDAQRRRNMAGRNKPKDTRQGSLFGARRTGEIPPAPPGDGSPEGKLAAVRGEQGARRTAEEIEPGFQARVTLAILDHVRRHGTVTADDVRAAGIEPPEGANPNCMGAPFATLHHAGVLEPHAAHRSKRTDRKASLSVAWRLANPGAGDALPPSKVSQ